jgi:EAL domain-containing protein (putative c-di-GMP-specific phosphodiesterase class I)
VQPGHADHVPQTPQGDQHRRASLTATLLRAPVEAPCTAMLSLGPGRHFHRCRCLLEVACTMRSLEWNRQAAQTPLAMALLNRFDRPAAISDPQGCLVAMNAAFKAQASTLTGSDQNLTLVEGSLHDDRGRSLPMPVVLTRLDPGAGSSSEWHLVELASRSVTLPVLAERFAQLTPGAATLLQLELREQGGLLNPLGVQQIESIVNALEERLLGCLPQGSSICRSRGERLIALVPGERSIAKMQELARGLQKALSLPLLLNDQPTTPHLSIGMSRSPQDGQGFELLLDSANQALISAHRQPKANICVAAALKREQRLLQRLARPLAIALNQGRLRLLYQPIVAMADHRIEGVEVLCRWEDPILGKICPTDFIPVAEATGQIHLLGSWLIDTVLAQVRPWLSMPRGLRYVSLNVSPLQLDHEGLIEVLRDGLERHGLNPSQIVLEITEEHNFDHTSGARERLLALHQLGLTLAMDDYGTGYSGLERLQTIPFGIVKVDRCLITAIETDPLQQAMLRGVVDLQNSAGLRVVAEGVERLEQSQTLQNLGCHLGQGFLFSKPMKAEQLDHLLKAA